jgi:D-serine deaminase-like pyridoxal phosphate-dependent protein
MIGVAMAATFMLNEFPWDPRYAVSGVEGILTPALVIYPEIVAANLERTLHLLEGNADRWRPHIKTAKLGYTVRRLIDHGIRNLKCATTLELMVACQCGAADVLLAYPTVGANARRVREIAEHFKEVRISVLAENEEQMRQWRGSRLGVFLDINSGMNRTGIEESHTDEIVKLGHLIGAEGLDFRGAGTQRGGTPGLRSLDENCGRHRARRNDGAGVNHRGHADAPVLAVLCRIS